MSARMGLMEGNFPTQEARRLFYDRLLRQLRGSAAFEEVGLTSRFRMAFDGSGPIEIEGRVYKEKRDRLNANFEQVTGSFFKVMSQRLLEGRTFNEDDLDSKLPVAIVNAAFAKKYFGNESAVGRRFRTGDGTSPEQYGPWRTIVGVVSTVRMAGPFNTPNVDASGFYVPFYSNPFGPAAPEPFVNQFTTLVVRPHAGQRATAVIGTLRREVTKVDRDLPLYFVGTPKENIDSFLGGNRVIAAMFSIFGVVAVLLASVGLYGVMSFSVNQRTQEFGVRMALGADYARILWMVLKQGSRQVALGLGLGLALALAIATAGREAIGNTLFDVGARDPLTYTSVIALVLLVSLVAVLVPARRATRVDPMIALRAQ
jgi:predicted permease